MLVISIPNADIPALNGDGAPCKINGAAVTLRLTDGYLCYQSGASDHRCKVLMREKNRNALTFMAASHGEDGEPHVIIGIGDDGQPADLLERRGPGEPDMH